MWSSATLWLVLSAWTSIAFATSLDTKIVNGIDAKDGEFPYLISLRTLPKGQHRCGGTLYNSNWVITAAHCVSNAKANELNIQYGSNKLDPNSQNVANICKIFVHEQYNPSNQFIHDIALLKLSTPVQLGPNIDVVTLPTDLTPPKSGTSATLAGWGLDMVSLRSVRQNNQLVCAGTILASQWILTAAHCFTFLMHPEDFLIQYGSNDLNPLRPKYKAIKKIIKHPGYNPTVIIHDIAIVQLATPITLGGANYPVQLVRDYTVNYENVTVKLVGWGLNETFGELSPKLQLVTLRTVNLTNCRSQLQSFIPETNLCAGGFNRGQCSGDSGGPLIFDNKQIALVSWSLKPCGAKPGVFTNVAYYLDWLMGTMANKTQVDSQQ